MEYYDENNILKKRINIIIIFSIIIILFILLILDIKVPFINKCGRNFLYIYLFHWIFIIIAQKSLFSQIEYSDHIIILSIILTLFILIIFGSDIIAKACNKILGSIHKNLMEYMKNCKIISFSLCLSFICLLIINPIEFYINKKNKNIEKICSLLIHILIMRI